MTSFPILAQTVWKNYTSSHSMLHFLPFFKRLNFYKYRLEAAGEVISGMALDYVGKDGSASFGDSRLNSSRIIRLFARPDPFCSPLCSI